MTDNVDIRGGAGEFEAAVIAAVLDVLEADEKTAGQGTAEPGLSAWVRAADPEEPDQPLEAVTPD